MAITKIQTITVGSGGAASIDFTSIPGTYTDLMIVYSLRATSGGPYNLTSRFNGDSGANYFFRHFYGNGAAVGNNYNASGETSLQSGVVNGAGDTANTFSNGQMYIPNYAGSSSKSVSVDAVTENNGTTAYPSLFAGRTTATAAITSITLFAGANFAQYSTATLYGILKGSSGGVTVS